jgi:hypothetical protein
MTAMSALRTLLAAGALLFSASPAFAYRTIENYPDMPEGARVHWPHGVFSYRVYETPDASIDGAMLAETSQWAFLAWAEGPCGSIFPQYAGLSASPAAPNDGENTIELVETDWARLGYPDEATGAADVAFQEQEDGSWAIVEADIYLNAEHHSFSLDDPPGDGERSLLGVLVHEGGHALGLLHSCEPEGEDGAPACDDEELPAAIMSPFYDAAETLPQNDDYEGMCYLYRTCEVDGCGEGFSCIVNECVADDARPGPVCSAGDDSCVELSPTGVRCTESNQCEGGECLEGFESGPVCTQLCGAALPGCPHNWVCSEVNNRAVCVPPADDGGCSVAANARRGSDPTPSAPLTSLAVLVLLSAARRRRYGGRS